MTTPHRAHDPLASQAPMVTHRWLLGGVAIVILGAVVTLYLAILLLFWQGQWQLIFHPSNTVRATPASLNLAWQEVRFDAGETGRPRLTGWWIPAPPAATEPVTPRTVILYMHDARGSLSDTLPDLAALHALGCDLFAFDPRGYGRSAWRRPSEYNWVQDGDAALAYLASVRHVRAAQVLVVGRGLGATIAAELTARNRGLDRLVMIDPRPPTLPLLESPRWTRILPVRLLASDSFDPTDALASPGVRRLVLLSPAATPPGYLASAAPPVTIVHAALGAPQAADALRGFLAQSAPAP